MNPGIDNKPFEIKFTKDAFIKNDMVSYPKEQQLEILSNGKRLWFEEILYYLSLGLYDRRGWEYKVKLIK